jgi:two-component sensor histidine kinase
MRNAMKSTDFSQASPVAAGSPVLGAADLDDDLLLDDELPDEPGPPPGGAPAGRDERRWRVLIVDDDESVRAITRLALDGVRVDGVALEVICVDSAEQARRALREQEGIAVALVDVVMESDTAGLEFIQWVRHGLGDRAVRLVVRTGQPGTAPESTVMGGYDIHDYLSKTETTSPRLISCVTGAIRAWRDLGTIERQREGLRTVLRAVDRLFEVRELDALLREVLAGVTELHAPSAQGAALLGPRGLSRSSVAPREVLVASGTYAPLLGREARAVLLADGLPIDLDAIPVSEVLLRRPELLYAFDVEPDLRPALVCRVEGLEPDSGALERTALYAQAVTLALRNRLLWERTVAKISQDLEEREVLLREVHHRVKNNLQIVSSLLSMQANKEISEEARAAIIDSGLRVRSIALVHQMLYGSRDFLHIHLGEATRDLARIIVASVGGQAQVEVDAQAADVSVDQAIPCCLILNELITNAIKHGRHPGRPAEVRVRIVATEEEVELRVSDGGPGFPSDVQAQRKGSLGWGIVESLVRQLRGSLRTEAGPGARSVITFPLSARD